MFTKKLQSSDEPSDLSISVWAVAVNGDALFRTGVTKDCPNVSLKVS